MVEERFGYQTATLIVQKANLQSRGLYSHSRNYHRREMNCLFNELQQQTTLPFERLSEAFGRHLCHRVLTAYPHHRAYINRIFGLITKSSTKLVFRCVQADERSLTILFDPAVKQTCITDGIIRGYLAHLRQLNRVQETRLANGQHQFVISVKS